MKYGLIFAGLLLLSFPMISFADIVPCFIGAGLVSFGIAEAAKISPTLESCREKLKKLITANLIRFASLLPMLSLSSGDKSMRMVFTIGFAVAEMIFVIPAVRDLFDGIEYICEREGKRASVRAGKAAMTAMLCGRLIFGTLPELIYLYIVRIDDETCYYPLEGYKGGVTVLCFLASLILLRVCHFIVHRCFGRLKKDTELNERIIAEAGKVPTDTPEKTLGAVKTFLKVLTAALILEFPIELDGVEAIPFFISPIIMLCGFAAAGKAVRYGKKEKKVLVINTVISVAAYVLEYVLGSGQIRDRMPFVLPSQIVYTLMAISDIVLLKCVHDMFGKMMKEHCVAGLEAEFLRHNALEREKLNRLEALHNTAFILGVAAIIAGAVSYWLKFTYYEARMIFLGIFILYMIIELILFAKASDAAEEKIMWQGAE